VKLPLEAALAVQLFFDFNGPKQVRNYKFRVARPDIATAAASSCLTPGAREICSKILAEPPLRPSP
jgi:hypothetical protein